MITADTKISRAWAMPSTDTLSVQPISDFAARHLSGRSVDPFARNCSLCTLTNDLNPATSAQNHEDAAAWLSRLADAGERFDSALVDPPYSPTQMSRSYAGVGQIKTGPAATHNGALYADVRKQLERLIVPGGVVLWFGWNSTGMGKSWRRLETLIVCHGGAHNDTICVADQKPESLYDSLSPKGQP